MDMDDDGWDSIWRSVWWDRAINEVGSAQLLGNLFRVVVVRDCDTHGWVFAESHTRCGRHWDYDSDY